MSTTNYPLVTMTMEQYEDLIKKCDRLKADSEFRFKAIWLVLDYFDTEDKKVDLMKHIVSNSSDEKLHEFIEKLHKFIENKIHEPKIKNVLGDLPPEALGKFKENIESFIKFNPLQVHIPKNIPLFKADK